GVAQRVILEPRRPPPVRVPPEPPDEGLPPRPGHQLRPLPPLHHQRPQPRAAPPPATLVPSLGRRRRLDSLPGAREGEAAAQPAIGRARRIVERVDVGVHLHVAANRMDLVDGEAGTQKCDSPCQRGERERTMAINIVHYNGFGGSITLPLKHLVTGVRHVVGRHIYCGPTVFHNTRDVTA
ncbi:hypothetical protein B296_00042156, partial [Ensete ventricosum]